MDTLTSHGYQVCQVFNENNKTMYVVNALFSEGDKPLYTSGVGETVQNAYSSAVMSAAAISAQNREINEAASREREYLMVSNNKENLNGGGNKPATPVQIEYVEGLLKRHRLNKDDYLQSKFNKRVENLTGSEADKIIKELK